MSLATAIANQVMKSVREVDKAMKSAANTAGRRVLTRAAQPMLKLAKSTAPVNQGALKKSLVAKASVSPSKEIFNAAVGGKKGFKVASHKSKANKATLDVLKKNKIRSNRSKTAKSEKAAGAQVQKPAKYLHLVENGRKAGTSKRGRKYAGMTGTGFLSKAGNATRGQAQRIIIDGLGAELDKQLQRARGKLLGQEIIT